MFNSAITEEHIQARMRTVVERFLKDEVIMYEDDAYALNSAQELCHVHIATIKGPRSGRIMTRVIEWSSSPTSVGSAGSAGSVGSADTQHTQHIQNSQNRAVAEKTSLRGFLNLCRDIACWECEELGLGVMEEPSQDQANKHISEFKLDPYEMT